MDKTVKPSMATPPLAAAGVAVAMVTNKFEASARNAPLAVRAVKRLVTQGMDMPLVHALEVDKYMFGLLRDTEDRIEGRKAFQEKRKPNYKGK